jgi:hypothetical protein
MRHRAVQRAHYGNVPKFDLRHPIKTHPTRPMYRRGKVRGRGKFALASTMGIVGAPAFAVGAHDYLTAKRDSGRFVWSQAADRLPDNRSVFFIGGRRVSGKDASEGIVRQGRVTAHRMHKPGQNVHRRGREVAFGSYEPLRPDHGPKNRRGFGAGVDRMPYRNAKGWSDAAFAEMQHASRLSGHSGVLEDVRPEMLRAHRRFLAVRGAQAAGGAAVLAGGALALHRRRQHNTVGKAERQHSFVREGITGTGEAVAARARNLKDVPPGQKIGPLAVATGAGGLGSLAAHRVMDRHAYFRGAHHGGRAGIAALAGTAAAAASYPLARHTVRSRDYEVTPSGVRRRKSKPVRPSSKGKVFDQKQMSRRQFRDSTVGKVHNPHSLKPTTTRGTPRKVHWQHPAREGAVCGLDGAFGLGVGPFAEHYGEVTCRGCAQMIHLVGKADNDYLGRRTPFGEQRGKTMAAGAIPLVPFAGPIAAARQSGKYAPPGEKRKAQGRQLASSAATTATGVAGAYGAAKIPKVGDAATRAHAAAQRATHRVTDPVKGKLPKALKKPGGGRIAQTKARAVARGTKAVDSSRALTRLAKPLRARPAAAAAGYLLGSKLSGQVYGNAAISRNQAAQRRYNLKHPVAGTAAKADKKALTPREQAAYLERKRRATTTSIATGGLGVAGATMGAALLPGVRGRLKPKTVSRLERAAVGTGLTAGGISGVHSIRQARLDRQNIRRQQAALGVKAARYTPSSARAHELAVSFARKAGWSSSAGRWRCATGSRRSTRPTSGSR